MTRRFGRRSLAAVVTVGIIAAFVVALVWTSASQSPTPHYQQRVNMPGMGVHPVSLWVDPRPHRTGTAELMAQVANESGSTLPVSDLTFVVTAPDQQEPVTIPGDFTPEGRLTDFLGNAPAYVAPIHLDHQGTWRITVQFSMAGREGRTTFDVPVGE